MAVLDGRFQSFSTHTLYATHIAYTLVTFLNCAFEERGGIRRVAVFVNRDVKLRYGIHSVCAITLTALKNINLYRAKLPYEPSSVLSVVTVCIFRSFLVIYECTQHSSDIIARILCVYI